MSRIVLDTSVLIDVTRGLESARAFLRSVIETDELWSVTPVRTELLVGARPREVAEIWALFDLIQWQDVTAALADEAGALAARYSRSHRIGTVDSLLAAATIELGGTVATLNVRDFPMFPGLQPPY